MGRDCTPLVTPYHFDPEQCSFQTESIIKGRVEHDAILDTLLKFVSCFPEAKRSILGPCPAPGHPDFPHDELATRVFVVCQRPLVPAIQYRGRLNWDENLQWHAISNHSWVSTRDPICIYSACLYPHFSAIALHRERSTASLSL